MSRAETSGTFEECADELNDFIDTLGRYPHEVLAYSLRAHLSGLLQALLLHGRWTPEQIAAFVQELEHEALHPQ
jgi:hypothetical protein